MTTDIDKLAQQMREAARTAQKVAPGAWEIDSERQDDTPDRYHEYALLDGEGRRMCGTENSDASFGEIHSETDDEGFHHAWNEFSRRLMEHVSLAQPANVLALLDDRERLREALGQLRKSATLLQQNAEGCAVNHYGEDFAIQGLPGWLADTAADIGRATAALATSGGGNG